MLALLKFRWKQNAAKNLILNNGPEALGKPKGTEWLFTGQGSTKGTASSDCSEPMLYHIHSAGANVPNLYEKGQTPGAKAYRKLH